MMLQLLAPWAKVIQEDHCRLQMQVILMLIVASLMCMCACRCLLVGFQAGFGLRGNYQKPEPPSQAISEQFV